MTGSRGPEWPGSSFFKITKGRRGILRCIFSNLSLNQARKAFMVGENLRSSGSRGSIFLLSRSAWQTSSMEGLFSASPSGAAGMVGLEAIYSCHPWWSLMEPMSRDKALSRFMDAPAKGWRELNGPDAGLCLFKLRCSYSLPPTENSQQLVPKMFSLTLPYVSQL